MIIVLSVAVFVLSIVSFMMVIKMKDIKSAQNSFKFYCHDNLQNIICVIESGRHEVMKSCALNFQEMKAQMLHLEALILGKKAAVPSQLVEKKKKPRHISEQERSRRAQHMRDVMAKRRQEKNKTVPGTVKKVKPELIPIVVDA